MFYKAGDMNPQVFRMIEDQLDVRETQEKTIEIITGWLVAKNITQTDVQKEMLRSHINAMVERAKTLEKLPEVDVEIFDELSEEALQMARQTVGLFNSLSEDEAYLLAVHYEVAKNNE